MAIDGSLNFDTRVNSNGFNTGVKKLGNSLNSLRSSLSKFAAAVGVAFSVTAVINFGKTCISTATEVENAWVGLNSIVNGQGKSFDNAKKFIQEYISDGLVPLKNAVIAYKNLSLRGYNTEQIETVMNAFKNSATYARQSQYSLGDAISTATEGLKNENSIVVDNAGVTKNVAKMWKDYAKSIGVSYTSLTKQQKIEAEVAGIIEETKFQMGDAAKYSNTYSGQIARLSASFTNLKVKIGNILKVVVSNFLPTINNAINLVGKFIDKITNAFNNLGIQTDIVDTLSDVSNGVENTTENLEEMEEQAEEVEKRLAGFDKLNVLEGNEDESNNTGSTDTPTASISVDMDTKTVESSADRIKKILSQINFTEVGKSFAEKINNALSNIDWETIKNNANTWAANIASFLNGAISNIDWYLVGSTIGNGINTVINFLFTFVTSFNWTEFGKSIEEEITGACDTIDWEKAGQTLSAGLSGIISVLPNLGTSLGKVVQGLIDTAFSFVSTFDWEKAGKDLIDTVNNFIAEIDRSKLAYTLSTALIGLWNSFKSLLANFDWGEFGKSIGEFIIGIDWWGLISGPLADLLNLIFNPLSWFEEDGIMTALWDFLTGIFEGLGITEYWANLIMDTWENIKNFFNTCGIGEFFGNIWNDIMDAFSNVTNWFRDTFSKAWGAVEGVFSVGGKIFNGIGESISNVFKNVVNGLIDGINNVIAVPFNAINTALKTVKSIEIAGWKPFEWITSIAVPQIPKLATGTVVPASYGEYLAVLGDNKREPEVVSPLSTMKQAMREVMAEMNVSANSNVEYRFVAELNGKPLFEEVIRQDRIDRKRHGGRSRLGTVG